VTNNTAWRIALVTLCVLALALRGLVDGNNVVARTGVQVDAAAGTLRWRIDVATPSPAYEAGLRSGDVVDAARPSSAERYRLWTSPLILFPSNWATGSTLVDASSYAIPHGCARASDRRYCHRSKTFG
jgi:hypothetical protein